MAENHHVVKTLGGRRPPEAPQERRVVPKDRIELSTPAFSEPRSTTELPRRGGFERTRTSDLLGVNEALRPAELQTLGAGKRTRTSMPCLRASEPQSDVSANFTIPALIILNACLILNFFLDKLGNPSFYNNKVFLVAL